MSKTFILKRISNTTGKIMLSYLELFYLRLYTHGLNINKISDFLELEHCEIKKIREGIIRKYRTKNWMIIISRAFKENHLQKTDYIDLVVKELTLKYTHTIFENYISATSLKIKTKELKKILLEFYYMCEISLNDQYDNKPGKFKLTATEQDLIRLKYRKRKPKEISSKLDLNQSNIKLIKLKRSVFKKMEVSNWFNVFKKALQLSIIDTPESHHLYVENKVVSCSNNITRVRRLKRLSLNEKKLSIYDELLELYSNIEFAKLIQNKNFE